MAVLLWIHASLPSPSLFLFFFPSTTLLHLYQALAEELEQKLSASHNRGLNSTETCQDGSQTPMPVPAKRKPIGSMFLFVRLQPSPDPAVQQRHLGTFPHPYRQKAATFLYFFFPFSWQVHAASPWARSTQMTILSHPRLAPSEIISVPKSALHAKKPSLPSPAMRRTALRMVRHCTRVL